MRHLRPIAFVGLFGLVGALAGCGGEPKQPTPTPPPVAISQPHPQPPGTLPPDPQQGVVGLDPTKHVIPATAAAGRLAGNPFTPDRIELEGNQLRFRQGKDFFADLSIEVFLNNVKDPSAGVKLVVGPTSDRADGFPTLHISTRKGMDLPDTKFVTEGYALTLELGKMEKGKAAGKIALSLPGADHSYLAGTFTAQRKRALSDPPGAEEVPFIQGSVTPPAKKGQFVWVGYVGLPSGGGEFISDSAGTQPFEDGEGAVRSASFEPRSAGIRFEKFTPHFDFTALPLGRYLIFARMKNGPMGWAWVTVPADGKITADLKLDEKNLGTVEVELPAGARDARLVPTDLGSPPPSAAFLDQLAFALDLRAEAKDGKATIANVPAGKYRVQAGNLQADVEVTAGKTTMAELKPAKK